MMWKLILIVAVCLFRYGTPSNSKNGRTSAISHGGTDNTSPNILSTERPIKSLDDITPLPLSGFKKQEFLEGAMPSVIPALNFDVTPEEILPTVIEKISQNYSSPKRDEDLITTSRSAISENSSKDVNTNGNVDSVVTGESSNFTSYPNIAGGSSFLEGATPSVIPTFNSVVTPGENLPSGFEKISHQYNSSSNSDKELIASSRSAIPENSDTDIQVTTVLEKSTNYIPVREIPQDQNSTEEKESSFPIPRTTQKNFYSSKSLVTTGDFKSLIPVGERVESSEEKVTRGNNSSGVREEEPIFGSVVTTLQTPDVISIAAESQKNLFKTTTKDIMYDVNLKQNFTGERISSPVAMGTAEESNASLSASVTTEESNSSLGALSTTEESNSTLSALRTTTRKKPFMPFSPYEKEIDSSQPTENESFIYRDENVEDHPSGYTPHNTSTYQSLNIIGKNTPIESSTAAVSTENVYELPTTTPLVLAVFDADTLTDDLGKTASVSTENVYELPTTTPLVLAVFNDDTLTDHLGKTTPYTQEDFGETPNVSNSGATNPVIFDSDPGETELPPSKQLLNQTYKLILTQNCSGESWLDVYQSLSSIFNSRLNAQNSTKFMKCAWVYEFNFTSSIASPESFKDVIDLIKEKVNPDAEVSIVNYDSSVYQVSHTSDIDSENFVVPKSLAYISAAATIMALLFMIFVIVCVRNKCRKSSTSLDLSDIPHLTLSVDDYKVAPIPRPSVSFPESNRDFLYAYSNETYSRTREDDAINQQHFSESTGKEFEAFKGQKDTALTLELQTFNARKGVSRNKPEKSVACHEYTPANSWDRLKGNDNRKKQGLDNPAIRW